MTALNGLRFADVVQIYNSTVTQMSACLLSLSVMSLLLPVCVRDWLVISVSQPNQLPADCFPCIVYG